MPEQADWARHQPVIHSISPHTHQSDALATENAEPSATIGWNVQQARLTNALQVIVPKSSRKSDVTLATKHVDQQGKQPFLVGSPAFSVSEFLDDDASVIAQWVGKLVLWVDHVIASARDGLNVADA
ncbi:MAG: hypothetical protein BWK72_19530 [Rhodoferax ferrireducens]|uniref:Uncharacterized protein n=1 Tax=Rhodoferax ferrireducens TaxID=192843 RepID=A0A1W9KQ79_9BURK|nr:MAG: hypothetical protein BWK72_19530 [Rhodoferax ferrireducens]